MATYVRFGAGFNITTNSSIDKRFVLSKAEMKAANPNGLPEVYFALCTDDKKMYVYDKNSEADDVTGKYHPLEEYLDFTTEKAEEQLNEVLSNSETITDIQDSIDALTEEIEEIKMDGGEIE